MTWNSSTPWNVCTTSILSFCKPPRCPISLPIFLSQKIRLPTVANVDSHRFWWGTFFKWFLTTYKAWALMAYQKCGENGTRWMETAVSRKAERHRRARKVISQDRHPESPKKTSATLRAPSVPAHTPGSGLKPCRRLTHLADTGPTFAPTRSGPDIGPAGWGERGPGTDELTVLLVTSVYGGWAAIIASTSKFVFVTWKNVKEDF